jgi:hypothetical protein
MPWGSYFMQFQLHEGNLSTLLANLQHKHDESSKRNHMTSLQLTFLINCSPMRHKSNLTPFILFYRIIAFSIPEILRKQNLFYAILFYSHRFRQFIKKQ